MEIIYKIKRFFANRREERKRKEEIRLADLFNLGFNKIQFPILIQDGDDLTVIQDFAHFTSDPDIYFFEFEKFTKLIDAYAKQFKWNYNFELKTNFPGEFIQQLTLDELKDIANKYFENSNVKAEIGTAKTSKELIEIISEYC
jgi:hypothetical protein